MQRAVQQIRIAHKVGAIERRAQHRGMRDLAAQPAADAAFDHASDRIGTQGIGAGLHGKRGAAGEPDAGMVAGADLVVDTEAGLHHALAALELLGVRRAHAALAGELALAVGDDHLEAALGGAHRLRQRLRHFGDAVGPHRAQPLDSERAQRLLDGHPGGRADAAAGARRQVLLAGGGRVAVLHHDQHAVAFVEQVGGDAGDEAVVPEAAVAHHRDRPPLHVRRDRGGARQRHAVAEDGVAEAERREGRERVAADVGADVGRPELALHQLDGAEHGSLGAAGAEIGRPRRDVAERCHGGSLVRQHSLGARRDRIGVDAGWPRLRHERGDAVDQRLRLVFAGARQRPLAEHACPNISAAQLDVDCVLDVGGRAFLDHQHCALVGAERAQLVRHQRERDVEHVDRDAACAVEIGEAEPRQRAEHAVGEPAKRDDAHVGEVAGDHFVELVLADECLCGREALLELEPLLREGDGRMRKLAVVEARRSGEAILAGEGGALVGLGLELAGDMAGADAQLHHHGRVARLGEREALLDHAHDRGQLGPRIEQPHRGFHGIGVGALLDHACAFAVVLAEDDHHAADHAGGGEIRERVGGHVGADDRLPGYRAAQWIVDRGAEHGRGRGLVGAGLQMHAEVADDVLGVDQHVEQVGDRRALVAADIAHARLQQRLGDREDALAVKGLAVAQLERLHLFFEGTFHGATYIGGRRLGRALRDPTFRPPGGCWVS